MAGLGGQSRQSYGICRRRDLALGADAADGHHAAVPHGAGSIADVDRVCRKFGVTSNDVALAAVTESFRSVLLHRGEQPCADSLRTASATLPYLPVHHEDPLARLRLVHNRLRAKPSGVRLQPGILESALNYRPIGLRRKGSELLTRLPRRGIVTLATNLPGPRRRLRLMGQSMERVLPIPPTALRLSTGVAVLSYGDELVFGITADRRRTRPQAACRGYRVGDGAAGGAQPGLCSAVQQGPAQARRLSSAAAVPDGGTCLALARRPI
jgi:WS/DGAT C-terminal domain